MTKQAKMTLFAAWMPPTLLLLLPVWTGSCVDGGWGTPLGNTVIGDLPDRGWADAGAGGGDDGPDEDAGIVYECGKGPGNKKGIGAPCTKGGNECKTDLNCDIDMDPQGVGICIKVMCVSDNECGSGATCCMVAQGGGVKVCIINECLPPECGGAPADGGSGDAGTKDGGAADSGSDSGSSD
jgi:hypothetical protein